MKTSNTHTHTLMHRHTQTHTRQGTVYEDGTSFYIVIGPVHRKVEFAGRTHMGTKSKMMEKRKKANERGEGEKDGEEERKRLQQRQAEPNRAQSLRFACGFRRPGLVHTPRRRAATFLPSSL